MLAPHLDFTPPTPDATLWRYMELWKFRAILETQQLYLASAESMTGDPFEGAYPQANSVFFGAGISPERQDAARRSFDAARQLFHRFRKEIFLSCWHMNDAESEVLWHRYAGGDGVVIKTTGRRLANAVAIEPREFYIGQVTYLDYGSEAIPVLAGYTVYLPFLFKRREFAPDKEVRMIMHESGIKPESNGIVSIDKTPNPPKACLVKVDPTMLIDAVVLCPGAAAAMEEEVRAILTPFGIANRVCRSTLDQRPNWGDLPLDVATVTEV